MAAAGRVRREEGFYSALNVVSSSDILHSPPRKKKKSTGRFYEVERLITSTVKDGKNEYLVKYRGYSAYETSWEPAENITANCIRLFENPRPPPVVVEEAITAFRIAVEQALKSKSSLPISINFQGDVFLYLFKGKGNLLVDGITSWREIFQPDTFPREWEYCLDSHGQGIKPFFPIKMRHFISWSPRKYVQDKTGKFIPAQRAFMERLTFRLVKVAAGDDST